MRRYNIYFKNQKINKKPLTKAELDYIKQYEVINKVKDKDTVEKIPIRFIRVVEYITF